MRLDRPAPHRVAANKRQARRSPGAVALEHRQRARDELRCYQVPVHRSVLETLIERGLTPAEANDPKAVGRELGVVLLQWGRALAPGEGTRQAYARRHEDCHAPVPAERPYAARLQRPPARRASISSAPSPSTRWRPADSNLRPLPVPGRVTTWQMGLVVMLLHEAAAPLSQGRLTSCRNKPVAIITSTTPGAGNVGPGCSS
jgi:hypothetical protein